MTTISEMLQQYGRNMLEHVSTQPWSDFQESDYTLEQWHNACLIHQHSGAPTSKAQCKLPVKTPSGVVNVNAVVSAAAALGGARGGVDATTEEKAKAKRALIGYYNQFNKPLPPSLKHDSVDDYISHYGVRGMKWGVRKSRTTPSVTTHPTSEDYANVATIKTTAKTHGTQALSNKQLQEAITRMNLEKQFNTLSNGTKNKGSAWAQKFLIDFGKQQVQQAANKYAAQKIAQMIAKQALKKAAITAIL